MNVLDAWGRVGLELPSSLAKQELNRTKVAFVYAQVTRKFRSATLNVSGPDLLPAMDSRPK